MNVSSLNVPDVLREVDVLDEIGYKRCEIATGHNWIWGARPGRRYTASVMCAVCGYIKQVDRSEHWLIVRTPSCQEAQQKPCVNDREHLWSLVSDMPFRQWRNRYRVAQCQGCFCIVTVTQKEFNKMQ